MNMCHVTGNDVSMALKQTQLCQCETTQIADSAAMSKVARLGFQHRAFWIVKKEKKIEDPLSCRVPDQ